MEYVEEELCERQIDIGKSHRVVDTPPAPEATVLPTTSQARRLIEIWRADSGRVAAVAEAVATCSHRGRRTHRHIVIQARTRRHTRDASISAVSLRFWH